MTRRSLASLLALIALTASCSTSNQSDGDTAAPSTTAAATTTVAASTTTAAPSTTLPTYAATIDELLNLGRPIVLAHTGGEDNFPASTLFSYEERDRKSTRLNFSH